MVFSFRSRRTSRFFRSLAACEALERRLNLSTFTVTTSSSEADGGSSSAPGGFIGLDGEMSLEEAIAAATATGAGFINPGPNTINFDIQDALPASGFWTLTLNPADFNGTPSVLVRNQLTINGYSQPGSLANNAIDGDNAKLLIQFSDPVQIENGGNTIKGISLPGIQNLGSFGQPDTEPNVIVGNFIGLDPAGHLLPTSPLSSDRYIAQGTTVATQIGGTNAADRNIFAGGANVYQGIELSGSNNNTIQDNFFGVRPGGTTVAAWEQSPDNIIQGSFTNLDANGASLGFAGNSIIADAIGGGSSNNNLIAGNVLANNVFAGVVINSGSGNAMIGNAFFNNGTGGTGGGIVFFSDGNLSRQAPTLTNITATEISGTLNGPALTTDDYRFEFFANDGPDAAGQLEGQRFLTSKFVSMSFDADGKGTFTIPVILSEDDLPNLTATVTDPEGNTSPFPAVSTATASLSPNPRLPTFVEGIRSKKSVTLGSFISDDPEARNFMAVVDWGGTDPLAQVPVIKVSRSGKGRFKISASNVIYREEDAAGAARTIRLSIKDLSGHTLDSIDQTTHVTDAPLKRLKKLTLTAEEKKLVEGKSISASYIFSDRNPSSNTSDFTATIDWGDGTVDNANLSGEIGTFTVNNAHVYLDSNKYTVTLTVIDNDPANPHDNPATLTTTKTIRVADAQIHVNPAETLTIGADGVVGAGQILGNLADDNEFADPKDLSVLINWGDKTDLDFFGGEVVKNEAGILVIQTLGTHQFANEGTYKVQLTILDEVPFAASLLIVVPAPIA